MSTFANGTIFRIGPTTISELISVTCPNLSSDSIDVSSYGQDYTYRSFLQGLLDGGEITIDGLFNSSDEFVLNQVNSNDQVPLSIDLPTSPSTTRFGVYVVCTGFNTEEPTDGVIPFTASYKVTGKPVLGQIPTIVTLYPSLTFYPSMLIYPTS